MLVGGAILIAFGTIFWPGIYRYDESKLGGDTFVVRTNRLTQKSQMLMGTVWKTVSSAEDESSDDDLPLPAEELAKLSGTRESLRPNRFGFKLYNGTNWTISKVRLKLAMVNAVDSTGTAITNPYLLPVILDDIVSAATKAGYEKRRSAPNIRVLWEREYSEHISILPLSTSDANIDVLDYINDQPILWTVVEAWGTPSKNK